MVFVLVDPLEPGLVAVAHIGVRVEGQFHHPVMRQVELAPGAVVIGGLDVGNILPGVSGDGIDPDGLHVGFRIGAGAHLV